MAWHNRFGPRFYLLQVLIDLTNIIWLQLKWSQICRSAIYGSYDSFTLNWRAFCLLGITFELVRVYSPKDYPSINRLNESSLTSFIILKILQKQLVPLALKWWRSPQLLVGLSKNNSNDANIFLRTFQAQRKPVWMVNNCKHANVYYVIFLKTTSSNIEITTFFIIMISVSFFKIQKNYLQRYDLSASRSRGPSGLWERSPHLQKYI